MHAVKHKPASSAPPLAEPGRKAAQPAQAPERIPAWAAAGGAQPAPSLFVQTKLTVNQPGDAYEQEADRVAEQVLRMPEPRVQRACACGGSAGPDDECEECRAKRLALQRKASVSGPAVAPPIVQQALRAPGQPLDVATRAFMEPRFGADFGHVRVHTNGLAAESARAVGARAYTVGGSLVFGVGQYQPGNAAGQRLIAHELTHTIQQARATPQLQRASDYDIRGVNPDTASFPNMIFFDMGNFSIPASESAKIAALAAPAGRALTLNGFSSEEGTSASNLAIINARINAVSAALAAAGHTGPRTRTPQLSAGMGQLDYRSVRAVEVVPTPLIGPPPSSVPQCAVTLANPHPERIPCGGAFGRAHPLAVDMVNKAVTAVTNNTPAAAAELANLFPGVARATVLTGLTGLQTQLGIMPARHECHNTCDGGCTRPGYNNGSGPTAMMTLCPGFINRTSDIDNADLLMHEGLHATPGLTTVDTAYYTTRMITQLSGAQAQTNTDSYVLLIRRLQPGGMVGGGPPVDPVAGMNAAEQNAARQALMYLEQWLLTDEFDTSLLYEAVKRNVGRVGGWRGADSFEAEMQHRIASLFGLTDPGPGPAYATVPTDADKVKIAGIYDRYHRMRQAVYQQAITVNKIAAGPDAWAANLGTSVAVTAPFFAMSPVDQVMHLVRLMLESMPDVPAVRRTAYAQGANQIRSNRGGIGP
jgi:hypothetical protein